MKPTFQTSRQARQIDSQRPQGSAFQKSPVTDWAFQSGADLRGTTASAAGINHLPTARGIYAVTQGFFEAETKWEERIEGAGLMVVIGLAVWPILIAIHTAMITV